MFLVEAILMSTHNICFYGELTKIILELSSNTLLTCSAGFSQAEFERKVKKMKDAKEEAKKYLNVAKKSTNTGPGPNEDLDPEIKKVSGNGWQHCNILECFIMLWISTLRNHW